MAIPKNKFLYLVIFLIGFCTVASGQQQHFIDSLKKQLHKSTDPSTRLMLYKDLAKSYRNLNPYIGLDYIDSAGYIAADIGNTRLLAQIINEKGVLYRKVDLYEEAIDQHREALRLFEQINDTMGLAFAYANMGNVFLNFSQLDKALEYNQKSLNLKIQLKDSLQIAYSLRTTALVLQAMKRFEESIDYFRQALEIYKYQGDNYDQANLYYHLGDVSLQAGSSNQALIYFGKAMQIFREVESNYGSALVNYQAGNTFLQIRQYEKADEYFKKALQQAQLANTPKIFMDANKALSELNKATGNYKESLRYFERYAMIRDSLFSENFSKNMAEMQAKYKNDEQLAEIALLKKENQLIKNEQRLKSAYLIILIAGIVFVLVVLGLLILRYDDKKKINKQLEMEIAIRKAHEKRLIESEQMLTTVNQTKDKFFSIISHDLKSPFGALKGLVELLEMGYEDMSEAERKELVFEISKATQGTYTLLNDLLTWSQTQRGNMDFNPKQTSIKKHILETVEFILPGAKKKNIDIVSQLPDGLEVFADLNMISTIVRNLLSNAVKFTPKGGRVEIKARKITLDPAQNGNRDLVEISVIDNGVGMSQEDQKRLFSIEEKFKSRGTENESGTGLGLVICKEFVEKHNCSISVKSQPGQGSAFTFTLPAAKSVTVPAKH